MACGTHVPAQPNDCFACKMDDWRANGPPINIPRHFDTSGRTVREQKRELYEDARRHGNDLQKV